MRTLLMDEVNHTRANYLVQAEHVGHFLNLVNGTPEETELLRGFCVMRFVKDERKCVGVTRAIRLSICRGLVRSTNTRKDLSQICRWSLILCLVNLMMFWVLDIRLNSYLVRDEADLDNIEPFTEILIESITRWWIYVEEHRYDKDIACRSTRAIKLTSFYLVGGSHIFGWNCRRKD